ncbi:MAG: class I fructose-bisphosphate aldolase [Limisphaerales bacterium]
MKEFRLNRLFNADSKRCLDVAMDHGVFNEPPFLDGLENMRRAVQTVANANPDAVQLTIGQAHYLQSIPGRQKPSLVLRTDVANVYGQNLSDHIYSRLIDSPVEQALRLDAVCVIVNIFHLPDDPSVTEQCIENALCLKPECDRYGMPLMIEPLSLKRVGNSYAVDGDIERLVPIVRQAVELGADIIKTDPADDDEGYDRVIETAGCIPVLVRGGSKTKDTEVLARVATFIKQGAGGIVYGRNIIQHENPAGMTRALMAVVHENATAEEAARHLGA